MQKLNLLTFCLLLCGLLGAQTPVTVAETNFKLPILGEEFFYFGFAEGDKLIFSFEEQNGKDLKEVEIMEWPATSVYKEYKTSGIQNKTFSVPRTGIYQFRFANSVLLQKTCNLKIQRVAASQATQGFNSTVFWRTAYDTTYRTVQPDAPKQLHKAVSLLPPTSLYLEPNTTGSKPQISVPVSLPDFASEWYYMFAVVDDKQKAEAFKTSFHLGDTITKKLAETGGAAFVLDSLAAPKGSNPCRIYLLDANNHEVFESRGAFRHFKEGTRENTSGGQVKIKTANFPNAYLGIRNPDVKAGIYVVIEAVAIIAPEEQNMAAEAQSVSVKARKEPYLKN